MVTNPLACLLRNCNCTARSNIDASCFARDIWGYIVSRVNNSLNAYTALMTEIKILVFGFIFLVRPFFIILDSFQNEIQQTVVLYFQIFQTKWRKKSVKINMSFDSAHFHIYISYISLKI
jgi:hypothetical protein